MVPRLIARGSNGANAAIKDGAVGARVLMLDASNAPDLV
jgi:hypothetical protein